LTTTHPLLVGLMLHLVGDYLTQSGWVAVHKIRVHGESRREALRGWFAATLHGFTYGLPFLIITTDLLPLAIIIGTHIVIDRFRLARNVMWLRNYLAPRSGWPGPWRECRETGMAPGTPDWLSGWLVVIVDNAMHIIINTLTLYYLVG
jgi:hypothetical protein